METVNMKFIALYFAVIIYYIYIIHNDTMPIEYLDLIFIWIGYVIIFLMWQFCDFRVVQNYLDVHGINYDDTYFTKILSYFSHKNAIHFLINSWAILSPQSLEVRMKLNRVNFYLLYLILGFIVQYVSENLQRRIYGYKYGILGSSGIMFCFQGFLDNIRTSSVITLFYFVFLMNDYVFIITASFGYLLGRILCVII